MIMTVIYTIAILVGFFVNTFAASALLYQQIMCGLDTAHKALLAVYLFNMIFFGAVLIVH